jgi:hypothetical protein
MTSPAPGASSRHLNDKRLALVARRDRLLEAFVDATTHTRRSRMKRLSRELRVEEFIDALNRIEAQQGVEHRERRYVVSSLFLEQCFYALTADADEQFL